MTETREGIVAGGLEAAAFELEALCLRLLGLLACLPPQAEETNTEDLGENPSRITVLRAAIQGAVTTLRLLIQEIRQAASQAGGSDLYQEM